MFMQVHNGEGKDAYKIKGMYVEPYPLSWFNRGEWDLGPEWDHDKTYWQKSEGEKTDEKDSRTHKTAFRGGKGFWRWMIYDAVVVCSFILLSSSSGSFIFLSTPVRKFCV